jgi:uncharacterized protein (TIGR03437 family)
MPLSFPYRRSTEPLPLFPNPETGGDPGTTGSAEPIELLKGAFINMNSAYSPRRVDSAIRAERSRRAGLNHCARVMLFALLATAVDAQVSNNTALNGKYFFRQVALLTGASASATQTQSASGTLVFDGNGNYTVNGIQLTGTAASTTLAGTGTYTVSPGGIVKLSDPLLPGVTVNARVGADGVLVGSATEAGPNTFDLLIGILAPVNPVTNRLLSGPYWVSSLEFPNGGTADIRDTNFKLTADGIGGFAETSVTGQANNLGNTLMTQTVGPMSYNLTTSDGSGTMTFPAAAGLDITTQLIEGIKSVYVSQDASMFIGGSTAPGGHGLMVGIKAWAGGPVNYATNASWNGFYFAAGMRYDTSSSTLSSVTASVNPTSQGAVWERRTSQSSGVVDTTSLLPYSLGLDGSGTYTSTPGHVDLASTGLVFSTSGVNVASSTSYELYFGANILTQSGTGLFLNPLGVLNAASYAPPGVPVSPGGFVALFGTGLAAAAAQAPIPFPTQLENLQVTVNGIPAPVYAVSPTQINAVVPYEVTGATATFMVTNVATTTTSNAVTVPLAATSPGVFSLSANGLGDGAILHANYSVVSQTSPALPGEIVQVFLTGLGAVNPMVPDGTAASATTLSKVIAPVSAFIGGVQVSNIQFQGLSPGLASLYQVNLQIPSSVGPGAQPLQVQTANGSTNLVDVWVGAP